LKNPILRLIIMRIKEGLQFKGKGKTSLKRKDFQIILLKMKICLRLKRKV
jgi:hypothetical protein